MVNSSELFKGLNFLIVASDLNQTTRALELKGLLEEHSCNSCKIHELSTKNELIKEQDTKQWFIETYGSTDAVHFIICEETNFPFYQIVAFDLLIPVVTSEWVNMCIATRKHVRTAPFSPDRRHIFKNFQIYVSKEAFTGPEQLFYTDMIQALGGTCVDVLSSRTTHLVTTNAQDNGIKVIVSFNKSCLIKFVLPTWIAQSFKLLQVVPVDDHQILPTDHKERTQEKMKELWDLIADNAFQRGSNIFKNQNFILGMDLFFNKELHAYLIEFLKANGGAIIRHLDESDIEGRGADIYIGSTNQSKEYEVAARQPMHLGNTIWLFYVWSTDSFVEPSCKLIFAPLKKKLFEHSQLILTYSNYFGLQRTYIQRLTDILGGYSTPELSRKNTHLITQFASGKKFETVRKWGNKCIVTNHLWLEYCYKNWQKLDPKDTIFQEFPTSNGLWNGPGQLSDAVLSNSSFTKGDRSNSLNNVGISESSTDSRSEIVKDLTTDIEINELFSKETDVTYLKEGIQREGLSLESNFKYSNINAPFHKDPALDTISGAQISADQQSHDDVLVLETNIEQKRATPPNLGPGRVSERSVSTSEVVEVEIEIDDHGKHVEENRGVYKSTEGNMSPEKGEAVNRKSWSEIKSPNGFPLVACQNTLIQDTSKEHGGSSFENNAEPEEVRASINTSDISQNQDTSLGRGSSIDYGKEILSKCDVTMEPRSSSPALTSSGGSRRAAKAKAEQRLHDDIESLNDFQRNSKRKKTGDLLPNEITALEKHKKLELQAEELIEKLLFAGETERNTTADHSTEAYINHKKPFYHINAISTGSQRCLSELDSLVLRRLGIQIFDEIAPSNLKKLNAIIAPKKMRTAKFLLSLSFHPLKYAVRPEFLEDILKTIHKGKTKTEIVLPDAASYKIFDFEESNILKKTTLSTKVFERANLFKINLINDIPGGVDVISSILKAHGINEIRTIASTQMNRLIEVSFLKNDIEGTSKKKKHGQIVPDYVFIVTKSAQVKQFKKVFRAAGKITLVVEWNWCVSSIFNLEVDYRDHQHVVYQTGL